MVVLAENVVDIEGESELPNGGLTGTRSEKPVSLDRFESSGRQDPARPLANNHLEEVLTRRHRDGPVAIHGQGFRVVSGGCVLIHSRAVVVCRGGGWLAPLASSVGSVAPACCPAPEPSPDLRSQRNGGNHQHCRAAHAPGFLPRWHRCSMFLCILIAWWGRWWRRGARRNPKKAKTIPPLLVAAWGATMSHLRRLGDR